MQLKAVLRQINPDHVNLFHGRPLPSLGVNNTANLAHRDAVGRGVHPIGYIEKVSEKLAGFIAEQVPEEVAATALVRHGTPYNEILTTAEEIGADLIMGFIRLTSRGPLKPRLLNTI